MVLEINDEHISIWCHVIHGKDLTYGQPCVIKVGSDGQIFGATLGAEPVTGVRGDRFITTTDDKMTGVVNSGRNFCISAGGFHHIDDLGSGRIRISKPKAAVQDSDLNWMFDV
jgi:hypothetical protein